MANPLRTLQEYGQSAWLDFVSRDLLKSGELGRLIADDGLAGMTTNPTIFEKAVSASDRYDADIRLLADRGLDAARIFEALAIRDVQEACDLFQPHYDSRGGRDGFVSLEVSPELARDAAGTLRAAQRLWAAVGRPNLMIKIPGTAEGLQAIEQCLALGINVNVTLLFAVERYLQIMAAHLAGLETRLAHGRPIDRVASVASFFVSRVDSKIDPMLDALGGDARRQLRGTIAIANAQLAYARFQETVRGPRWQALAARGAQVQRPLWASTSTKDPAYPDVYYVEALVAPQTVDTLPPETLAAYRDHGDPQIRIGADASPAEQRLRALGGFGIDLAQVTRALEVEGIAKFAASYAACLDGVAQKAAALSVART